MRRNLTPDIELAERLFAALRAATFDGVGITREAYGPGERIAHDIVTAQAVSLGLDIATDPAGNLLMTLPGADRAAPRVVIGSHLDSVPRGGNFDGAAGVLAGLAAVSGMRRAGVVPGRDIVVLAIRAEEGGAWFPTSFPGSRAALGTLPPAALVGMRPDGKADIPAVLRSLWRTPRQLRPQQKLLLRHRPLRRRSRKLPQLHRPQLKHRQLRRRRPLRP